MMLIILMVGMFQHIRNSSRLSLEPMAVTPAPGRKDVIDLNIATETELSSLPGIGETLSQRIIAYRQEHGTFTSVEELLEVKGISKNLFTKIKPYLTVGGPP